MPASTAQLVLANTSLRWSSPVLFNDPFDVPRELYFGVSAEELSAAVVKRLTSLIEHPPQDTSDLLPALQVIADVAGTGTGIPPDARAEILASIKEPFDTTQLAAAMEELRALWRSWIPDFRILCLADSPIHAAMWLHYADSYKGVVLEFNCDDEIDSPWLRAEAVSYPAAKPEVFEADGWAKLMMMPIDVAKERMLHLSTLTKAPDWSYEKEWRITTWKRDDDSGLYTDYPFRPREMASIYLGPLMAADNRRALLALSTMYPQARVIEVTIGMSREFLLRPIT
jgi:hypothetical protein